MFSSTHKIIAGKVFEALKFELGAVLDLNSFKFGSIAPDIHPLMMLNSHCKKDSFEFVKKEIEELLSMPFPESQRGLKIFSYKLGIIVHFISDYFCKAHNDSRYTNMIFHYAYEHRLKRFFERRRDEVFNLSRKGSWKTYDSVLELIEKKHMEYNALKRSMSKDMEYSIKVSAIASLKIVELCMANSLNTTEEEELQKSWNQGRVASQIK